MTARVLLAMAIALIASVAQAQNITVYSSGSVAINETRQLTAYVPLSPNTVTWSVNGIPGGDSTVGTVSATGLYKAPAAPPSNPAVSVRATSTAYADKFNAVTINVTQPPVQLWSISPASGPVGPVSISLNGSNFKADSVVKFGDVPLATTFVSATKLRASGSTTAAQAGKSLGVKVVNPGLGGTTSGSVTYAVAAATSDPKPTEPTPNPTPSPTPITISLSPNTVSLALAATRQFTATVSGSDNRSVSFSVNGVDGGNASVGTISGNGLYTAPSAAAAAMTVTVRVTSVANPSAVATATVNIAGPPDAGTGLGTPNLAAARLLEQASFGPTPASIQRVQTLGVNGWLDEQFSLPETAVTDPGDNSNATVRSQYVSRLSTANDQLRQRVAYALGQIIVISMNKNNYPPEIVPYLQILSRNAFGNYRTLLGEISTSSQMGKYLDIANSNKPVNGSGANENYPRELLQLFTIGLVQLSPDGAPVLDQNGKPVPTYDQATVQQVALAFTGWTYAGAGNNNWENFTGPLVPREINHDTRAKAFLGCNLPASQTATVDLNAALDCIFRHPNVGPFIATRLIRSMVTSNPSPGYIQRVAAAFDNNGSGVKGDLRATVRAILTDPEARNDAADVTAGHLRDPILHLTTFVRALNGTIRADNQLSWELSRLAEMPLVAPSVFGFYSPLYRVPRTPMFGPEFQIYSPTEAVLRGNLFWRVISNPAGDFNVDLTNFNLAASPVDLIDRVDQALLYGRMPQAMRQTLANILAIQDSNQARVQMALYLTALSGLYAVQH